MCESGISSANDLAKLRQRGVNLVLVGEYLLRQPDPGQALRDLLNTSGHWRSERRPWGRSIPRWP